MLPTSTTDHPISSLVTGTPQVLPSITCDIIHEKSRQHLLNFTAHLITDPFQLQQNGEVVYICGTNKLLGP